MIQDFKTDLDKIFNLIKSGNPFALMRFADGEIGVMQGRQVNGSDRWTSPQHLTKLGQDLLNAISKIDPNVYYGISCQCCDIEGKNYFYTL